MYWFAFPRVLPTDIYPLFPLNPFRNRKIPPSGKVYQLFLKSVSMFFSPSLALESAFVTSTVTQLTPKQKHGFGPKDYSTLGRQQGRRCSAIPLSCPLVRECVSEAQGLLVLQLPTKSLFQAQLAALNDISWALPPQKWEGETTTTHTLQEEYKQLPTSIQNPCQHVSQKL